MSKPAELDSASSLWMKHYFIDDCPHCFVADLAKDSRFCAKGRELRKAALAEFKAIPKPEKKPHHSVFNPAMERRA